MPLFEYDRKGREEGQNNVRQSTPCRYETTESRALQFTQLAVIAIGRNASLISLLGVGL